VCTTSTTAIETYRRGAHRGRLICDNDPVSFDWTDESNLTVGELHKYNGDPGDYAELYQLWTHAVDIPNR
jgi:hypothetical protein